MDNETTEIVSVTALESIERASIDMQIATAKRWPMHSPKMLSKVKEDMMTLATLDEETAAACFYTLPRGGKAIQGPSVRLAEIALNCYGNIRVGTRIIDIDDRSDAPHVVIQSVCHDLENNALITIEKRRRITKKKFNERIDEDDIQLATNACTSIAYRDAAFKLIPMAIIKPVWQAAKALAIGDIRSLTAKRTDVIDRLKKMGATEDRILSVVGCRKVEDIGMDELGQLIGLGTALRDGETTLEDAFPLVYKDKAEETQKSNEDKSGSKKVDVNLDKTKTKKKTSKKAAKKPETKEPKFVCNKCNEKFDKPKMTGPDNTVKTCPKCGSMQVEMNEEK